MGSKIIGTEGIQSASDPQQYFTDGSWSITFTFNDEGAIAFRQAIIDSGATENPDEHPVSIVLDNKTIAAQPLSQEFANKLKQRAGKIVMVSTGSGIDGQVQASNIVNTIRASRGNSWKLF
jgi:preprotein translocase subunit SecD